MTSDRGRLETALRELGGRAIEVPPFARVWRAARVRCEARRRRLWLYRGAIALPAAALLVALLVLAPRPQSLAPETPAGELARALSNWAGPLDFLLEPPAGGLLGYVPEGVELPLDTDLSALQIEEVL